MRDILLAALMLSPLTAMAGGELVYQFSFGTHLVLDPPVRRVLLTVGNPSAESIECGLLSLVDTALEAPVGPRVRFTPVPGQEDCLGGACLIDVSPNPHAALFVSVGPFLPGEQKSCAFDVQATRPFQGSLVLQGMAEPITIVQPGARVIPAFGLGAGALLVAGMVATAMRRRRTGMA